MSDVPLEPRRAGRSVRLTFAGKALGIFFAVSLLPALALAGAVAILPAVSLALLGAAALGAWLNLRRVEPEAPSARRAYVGESFELVVPLVNRSSLLRARDVIQMHGALDNERGRTAGYAPSLEPGERRRVTSRHRLLERGRHRSYTLHLASTFPLGLVEHRVAWEVPADFLVLPRLGYVRNLDERIPPSRGLHDETLRQRFGNEELHGLREWREGESQHLVHWKLTARHGKPIVREMRGEERPPIHLMLSTAVPGRRTGRRHRAFEEAVSLVATLAESFLRKRYRVRFSLLGAAPRSFECERGRYGLVALLTVLAQVQPTFGAAPGLPTAPPPPRRLGRAAAARRAEIPVVVLVGTGSGDQHIGTDALVLDVEDRGLDEFFTRARATDLQLPLVSAPMAST